MSTSPREPAAASESWKARLDEVIDAVAELASTADAPLDLVLKHIAELARRLAHAKYAAVGVPGPDDTLERFVVAGLSEEEVRRIGDLPRGRGLLGALIREKRPIRLREITADPRSVGFPSHHPPMRSFLGVPIHWKGKVLGNLYITEKLGAEEFSAEDERIIVALAAHAAGAIENYRLYEEIKGLNAQLRQANEEAHSLAEEERQARKTYEALAGVARDIAAEVELPSLLETLVVRTRELTGADLASVATVDPETGQAIWRAVVGQRSSIHLSTSFPPGSGLAGRVIRAGAPVIVHPGQRPDEPLHEFAVLSAEEVKVALGVPLATGSTVFGALIVAFRSEHAFCDAEIALAQALADHASVAIENARLVASLRQLNQTREEEIKLISHDLRAPLTIILGQGQMLPRLVAADNKQAAARACDAIVSSVKRMNRLIQDLVDAARLESGSVDLRRELVDLPSFLVDLKGRLSSIVDPERVRVTYQDGLPPVLVDPGRLDRILSNLLINAAKYSPPDAEIDVEIGRAEDEVLTSVSDRGVGIRADQLPHLFRRFYRAGETKVGDGLGLGLYITKKLVEAHGGRVWAESEGAGRGATFRFTLPTR